VWHVSLSTLGLLPLAEWSELREAKAHEAALALLAGLGERDGEGWKRGTLVLHLRRPLTGDEQSELPLGWMAIPAVDRG